MTIGQFNLRQILAVVGLLVTVFLLILGHMAFVPTGLLYLLCFAALLV